MSGIVVAVCTDGAPVRRPFAERLTHALAVRGPDRQMTWCEGQAALGHALLQTGLHHCVQPFTLDGSAWIVADARIDDRETLAATLDMPPRTDVTDAELILRAFMKWQARCVEHLLGDFAFAIWSPVQRHLFCARDHLGVKPLHYFASNQWLLVSSSVACIRLHPAVSDVLDDTAVADFLLFGHNADPASTTFRDIRRLPPAHVLTWTPEQGCRTTRYWELPIDPPAHRKGREHTEELRALLDRAVADRLRTSRVSVLFSGGMDSTTVAAVACARVIDGNATSVRAFSFVYDALIGGEERKYATAAANHLGIRCQFYDAAAMRGWCDDDSACTPEPLLDAIRSAVHRRCLGDMAAHGPVAFSGEGPDNALVYEWTAYVRYLWRAKRFGQIAGDGIRYLRQRRALPRWSAVVGARPRRFDGAAGATIPRWLSPDLVRMLHLEDRWRFVMRPATSRHPVRPEAYFSFGLPLWRVFFDSWDPCYTGVPLDVSHPYLDIRIVRFLLALPVIPWCREKHILRFAFRNELPAVILRRPKAPLSGSLELAKIRREGLPPVPRSHRLEAYAPTAGLNMLEVGTPSEAEAIVRLSVFSRWLVGLESNRAASATD